MMDDMSVFLLETNLSPRLIKLMRIHLILFVRMSASFGFVLLYINKQWTGCHNLIEGLDFEIRLVM